MDDGLRDRAKRAAAKFRASAAKGFMNLASIISTTSEASLEWEKVPAVAEQVQEPAAELLPEIPLGADHHWAGQVQRPACGILEEPSTFDMVQPLRNDKAVMTVYKFQWKWARPRLEKMGQELEPRDKVVLAYARDIQG